MKYHLTLLSFRKIFGHHLSLKLVPTKFPSFLSSLSIFLKIKLNKYCTPIINNTTIAPPIIVAAVAYPYFANSNASSITKGKSTKFDGCSMEAVAKSNTLVPNEASTASNKVFRTIGKIIVLILVNIDAPCTAAALSKDGDKLANVPNWTRTV